MHAHITPSHLHFVHGLLLCVWHHLVSTGRTLPHRPVNRVSLVTWMQQHLSFINNNTRCVVFHVVLCVLACERVFVQDHVLLMMCTHPECCNLQELLLSYSRDGWQLYYGSAAPLHKVSGRRCVLTLGSMVYHLQTLLTFWIEQQRISHSGWTEDEELLLSGGCHFQMTLWKAWNLTEHFVCRVLQREK